MINLKIFTQTVKWSLTKRCTVYTRENQHLETIWPFQEYLQLDLPPWQSRVAQVHLLPREKVKVSQTSQSCPSALTSTNQCRLCHIALLYPVNPYALHCSTLTSSWLWILAVKTYIRLSQHIYCTDVHISQFGPCAEDYDIADIVTVHCCNEQSRHVKASNPNSFQCKGQTYVHWFQKFAIGMFCKKVM